MRKYKLFDKSTGFYIGTVTVNASEVRNLEHDYIVKEA